ncbi:Holliday junction ATP-dependent DNA helicase RuvA [compost metagenome]
MDTAARTSADSGPGHAADEAISALIALGYKPQEASRFVHGVARDAMTSEEIIREALKASIR